MRLWSNFTRRGVPMVKTRILMVDDGIAKESAQPPNHLS